MFSMTVRVMLLSLTLLISGCGALVVSGAADNSYPAREDGRSAAQVSQDASITASINRQYVRDELVSAMEVRVETYGGVVTLRGRVPSGQALERAVSLASTTPGVRRVVSRLVVTR